jgi:hypothetical protein
VRVTDNGPGIDPVVAGELFERFARGDASRARQTGGTGLGLSIAKAIVTAHHGTISVNSEPGHTEFEVRLPARPAAPHAADAPPDQAARDRGRDRPDDRAHAAPARRAVPISNPRRRPS